MTEIVVGVRLNADGSGLVGQLRLSKAEMDQLRSSEKGAADAARDLSQATAEVSAAQQGAANAAREAGTASSGKAAADRGAAVAARDAGSAANTLTVADKAAADAARLLTSANDQAAASFAKKAVETRKAAFQLSDLSERSASMVRAERAAADASDKLTGNIALQRVGWQQVGFQVQDVFASYASGSKLTTIFAQQSGQLASAITLIAQSAEGGKGKLAGLASFLGGPWGIALGVAVAAGSSLAATLLEADKAAGLAEIGASGLADAQGLLGQMFDLTTGKIKTQNELLLVNARLMAINLRAEAQKERSEATQGLATAARDIRTVRAAPVAGANFAGQVGADFVSSPVAGLAREVQAAARLTNEKARSQALMDLLGKTETIDFSRSNTSANEFRQYIVNLASSSAKEATSELIDQSLKDNELAPGLRQADRRKPKKDNSAEKAAKEAERLAAFSDRAAEAVARINDEYNLAPRDIDRARQATAQLDGIIEQVNKRLSSGKNLTAAQRAEFVKIKADAEALKPVIQESLVRPIRDMLDSQSRQIELGKLQVSGRQADAEALQLTYQLMDKMGVESEEQLATELAKRGVTQDQVRALYDNLGVMRQQTREMRVQQQLQQTFLRAVDDMRENVRLTLEDLRKDGPRALGDFAKRSLDVLDRLFSEAATEKLFGNFFRDLEDQITGGDALSKAGDKMADAVARASKDIKQTSGDILDLGKAARQAKADISSAASGGSLPAGWIVGDDGQPFDPSAPITVMGGKNPATDILKELKGGFKEGYGEFFDELKGDFRDIFSDIFGDKGVFSDSLGKTLGGLTAGAQMGATAGNLVTDIFGIKGSQTAGAIGGAIGSAIGGPLGSVIGGTLGSVVGGMLKKTKTGAANITSVDGDASLSGNSSAFKEAASGAATSVQDGLSQIAEMLGGAIGAFNVTIGQRHGDWRVRTGTGSLKIAKGAKEFDDDQAGAIAYAIQLAVSQGAVTGISSAIQKALSSSDDINKALEEALKVQEVETLLGGLGSQMVAQFKAFENQAKERVRIATQYGFDVVAIEKKNAEDRAALVESLLEDQVGSLQRLVKEMTAGSLFEGSAVEQRDAILAEIDKAKADVAAGKDGAADTLATLLQQLAEVSKEAFGTTGQYAADRAMILAEAEKAIAAAQAQINAAAAGNAVSDPALATTNQALDENNDQNAQVISLLETLIAQGQQVAVAAANGLNAAALARTS